MAYRKPKKEKEKKAAADDKKAGAGAVSMVMMFVMMLMVFIVGAGMVVGYYHFFGPASKNESNQPKKEKEVALTTFDLGDMVVNLSDLQQTRFLKTKITLGYPQTKENEQLIDENKNKVIEEVLLTLRQKSYADVSPPSATNQLKTELIKSVNDRLKANVVKELYFTEYIVQ